MLYFNGERFFLDGIGGGVKLIEEQNYRLDLFGIPIDLYITPGLVWHWNPSVQSSIQEYVVAIKGYYTFNWPTGWRFGFAEGFSYVSDITYIELS